MNPHSTAQSLGEAISLYYAGTYPENLERLIIVDSAGMLNRSAFLINLIFSDIIPRCLRRGASLCEDFVEFAS